MMLQGGDLQKRVNFHCEYLRVNFVSVVKNYKCKNIKLRKSARKDEKSGKEEE